MFRVLARVVARVRAATRQWWGRLRGNQQPAVRAIEVGAAEQPALSATSVEAEFQSSTVVVREAVDADFEDAEEVRRVPSDEVEQVASQHPVAEGPASQAAVDENIERQTPRYVGTEWLVEERGVRWRPLPPPTLLGPTLAIAQAGIQWQESPSTVVGSPVSVNTRSIRWRSAAPPPVRILGPTTWVAQQDVQWLSPLGEPRVLGCSLPMQGGAVEWLCDSSHRM